MKPLPVSTLVEKTFVPRRVDALAYAFDSERMSYGQLHNNVGRIACGLAAGGLQRGDRCAVLLPTSLDFVRAFYGVQTAGAVPLAINSELPPPFLISQLEAVQC